jgi:hypothetical protein
LTKEELIEVGIKSLQCSVIFKNIEQAIKDLKKSSGGSDGDGGIGGGGDGGGGGGTSQGTEHTDDD